MFVLSTLWRISISTHPNYSNVDLPLEWEDDLRRALDDNKYIPESRYTVAVYKMRDSTLNGALDNETLRGLIMAPFARTYGHFVSVCFPLLGFLVETFFPRVPERFAKRRGVLRGSSSPQFLAPYVEALDTPEMMRLLVRGLEKHLEGLSRVA
jgi:hypothetical protein